MKLMLLLCGFVLASCATTKVNQLGVSEGVVVRFHQTQMSRAGLYVCGVAEDINTLECYDYLVFIKQVKP